MIKIILNILELRYNIEKNRANIGKKIADFFIKTNQLIIDFFKNSLSQERGALAFCCAIVLVSLYKRSVVDIGQDSGLYLEITQKILAGKRYYEDFFEYNFPTTFILLIPPVYIANFLQITPLIIADYYVNLLAILSLFYSYQILKKSDKFKDQFELSIFIILLTMGFFLRVKATICNEFLTKSSFFLIIIFPIISYFLYGIEKLLLRQKIILGILYATLIALKPNFVILIFLIELSRICQVKKIKALFETHLIICAISLALYAVILWIYFQDFIDNFFYMMSLYNEYKNKYSFGFEYDGLFARVNSIIILNRKQLVIYALLLYVYSRILKFNALLKYLFLLALTSYFIAITENYYFDQLVVFYSLFVLFVSFGFLYFLRQYKIHFSSRWFFYIALLIYCFFSREYKEYLHSLLFMNLGLCLFSFVVVIRNLGNEIFDRYKFVILPLLLSILIISLYINNNILNVITLTFALYFLVKNCFLHQRFFDIIIVIILLATFTMFGGYFKVIADPLLAQDDTEHQLISPNLQNIELLKIKKNYLQDNENMIIIARDIFESYPFRNYAKIINNSELSYYETIEIPLTEFYHRFNPRFNEKAFSSLLKQMKDKNNKVIVFFNNYKYPLCSIGFLEYFLRDDKIRNYFVENFQYLTTFSKYDKQDSFVPKYTKEGLNDYEFSIVNQLDSRQLTTNKNDIFEAYIRK